MAPAGAAGNPGPPAPLRRPALIREFLGPRGLILPPGRSLWRSRPLPTNTYEGMFLLDSTKVAVNWEDSVHQVHQILSKHGSEIVASRQWDERRLAYPISGHKKGTYLLTFF